MGRAGVIGASLLSVVMAGSAAAQPRQQVTGPVSTYWMSAETASGMAGMMGPQGKGPSMGAMMGMMMGGGSGSQAQKHLLLQLGSSRSAAQPAAQHAPPAGLGAGASLPLLTPKPRPVQRAEGEIPEIKGKLLIFWGCGDKARPGQPITIDFSKMTPAALRSGQMPAGFEALSKSLSITPMQGPAQGRNTTYGEWPNEKTRTRIAASGSLAGDHLVQGNYTPDIRFTLTRAQDFLGPLSLNSSMRTAGGGTLLSWKPLNGALAYFAMATGASEDGTVAIWTSSEAQAALFAAPDYLSPGDITRLLQQKALMAPSTTSCAVPSAFQRAAPAALVQLAAYGQEANFVYPPRPTDPKVAWNQEWQVKVRYRSVTSSMLGMEGMGGMDGGDDEPSPRPRMPFGIPRF